MKNTKLIVKAKSKSYPIYFGNNILNMTGKLIEKNMTTVKKIIYLMLILKKYLSLLHMIK